MLEIRQVPMGGDVRDFLDVVSYIYASDPSYIRPLDQDLKDRLNPNKNPLFDHAEGTIFLAYRNGKCVGRVTATIDHEHLARYKDDTGFWGFLDTVDDPEVAKELLTRAESWLRGKGMKRARGPISMSINEEMGCLVEGFDSPPVFMNPHHRPYQAGLIEAAGYAKVKDVFGWHYVVGELNARAKRGHAEIQALPEVKTRAVSPKDVERDVGIIVDVFNDAWCDNWGFVPLTKREVAKMAADFKLILLPELTRIVSIDGEAAAVAVALPNLNDLARDLNGKLFPTGLFKLLYRLKVQGPKSARLLILGIRRKYRHVRKYAALSAFLYAELNDSGRKLGVEWGELGWTLEDNGAVNAGIRMMGAKPYKKYRVFEKGLNGAKA
ncbi:MAG TPA: hypothetical protein VGI39_21275 [Polyangiaceae bacterium]